MRDPDYHAMAVARATVDEQLNLVLAFVAPTPEKAALAVPATECEAAGQYVSARIAKARDAINRFEDAAKGGA